MNQLTKEAKLQYEYMEKAAVYVKKLEEELSRKPTCCVTTFGCQMNARDSEKLRGILLQIGYVEAEEDEADLLSIIHVRCVKMPTCVFMDV